MELERGLLRPAFLLILCTLGSLVPSAWVAFPAAAVLLLWLPGRSLITLLRPLPGLPGRGWVAVSLSLMMTPLLLNIVWGFSNQRALVLASFVSANAVLIGIGWRMGARLEPVPALFPDRRWRWAFAAILAWSAGLVCCVYWIPTAGQSLLTSPVDDYVKHHAITWSLLNFPLPLHNIFYSARSAAPYYYYEHFYLLPAALCVLTGHAVSIPVAFGFAAGTVTACFLAMILLIARSLIGSMPGALLAVTCASIVGGLDFVPTLVRFLVAGRRVVVMDAWCPLLWRINNLMDDYLWCPQHVAATGLLLLCAYLLQQAPRARWWAGLAPLAAVALFACSVFQAMVFFPAAALYVLLELRRAARDPERSAGRLLAAVAAIGGLAGLAMLPRALQYLEMSSRYQSGLTLRWDRFDLAVFGRLLPPGPLANFLDAPWLLLVDFGIGALACLMVTRVAWRRCWADHGARLLMLAGILGVALMWGVRSTNPRDFGFRLGSMPAFVTGAIMVGFLLDPELVRPTVRSWRGRLVIPALVLGLPVGLYEAPGQAFRRLFESQPERAEAAGLHYLRDRLAADAVVQMEPRTRVRFVQLVDRQMGVMDPGDPHVNVLYPPDGAGRQLAMRDIEEAFGSPDAERAHQLFVRWGITHVFVGDAERERYGTLPQLADRRWFKVAFVDGRTAVYALADPGPFGSARAGVQRNVDDKAVGIMAR
jgi:hypothetical protein